MTLAAEKKTILVVEDDILLLAMLSETLRRRGYNVLPALSAKEALSVFRRSKEPIDLAVVDFSLPDIDGVEVSIQFLRHNPAFKILGMSGMVTIEDRFQAIGVEFIRKPFETDQLVLKIDAYVNS
jgi:two-component system cell cycle sensor histidine kinase/response regulator CckA